MILATTGGGSTHLAVFIYFVKAWRRFTIYFLPFYEIKT